MGRVAIIIVAIALAAGCGAPPYSFEEPQAF